MSRSPELYRQLEQAAEQAAELQTERWALTEVLGRMQADARALEARAARVEQQCNALDSQLQLELERDAQLEKEIWGHEGQARVLQTQSEVLARRLDALLNDASSLEQAVRNNQREVSVAQQTLAGAVERVMRLDYAVRFCFGSHVRNG